MREPNFSSVVAAVCVAVVAVAWLPGEVTGAEPNHDINTTVRVELPTSFVSPAGFWTVSTSSRDASLRLSMDGRGRLAGTIRVKDVVARVKGKTSAGRKGQKLALKGSTPTKDLKVGLKGTIDESGGFAGRLSLSGRLLTAKSGGKIVEDSIAQMPAGRDPLSIQLLIPGVGNGNRFGGSASVTGRYRRGTAGVIDGGSLKPAKDGTDRAKFGVKTDKQRPGPFKLRLKFLGNVGTDAFDGTVTGRAGPYRFKREPITFATGAALPAGTLDVPRTARQVTLDPSGILVNEVVLDVTDEIGLTFPAGTAFTTPTGVPLSNETVEICVDDGGADLARGSLLPMANIFVDLRPIVDGERIGDTSTRFSPGAVLTVRPDSFDGDGVIDSSPIVSNRGGLPGSGVFFDDMDDYGDSFSSGLANSLDAFTIDGTPVAVGVGVRPPTPATPPSGGINSYDHPLGVSLPANVEIKRVIILHPSTREVLEDTGQIQPRLVLGGGSVQVGSYTFELVELNQLAQVRVSTPFDGAFEIEVQYCLDGVDRVRGAAPPPGVPTDESVPDGTYDGTIEVIIHIKDGEVSKPIRDLEQAVYLSGQVARVGQGGLGLSTPGPNGQRDITLDISDFDLSVDGLGTALGGDFTAVTGPRRIEYTQVCPKPTVVVTNLDDNELVVLDPDTFDIDRIFPLPGRPGAVELSGDGKQAYVKTDKKLICIDTVTGRVSACISTKALSDALALTLRLVITVDKKGTIEGRDRSTLEPVWKIGGGERGGHVGISTTEDERFGYFTAFELPTDHVRSVDLLLAEWTNQARIDQTSLVDSPFTGAAFGVAAAPDGDTLYLNVIDTGELKFFEPISNQVVRNLNVGQTPLTPQVSPSGGHVAVPAFNSNHVAIVDTATGTTALVPNIGGANSVTLFCTARDGERGAAFGFNSNDAVLFDLSTGAALVRGTLSFQPGPAASASALPGP